MAASEPLLKAVIAATVPVVKAVVTWHGAPGLSDPPGYVHHLSLSVLGPWQLQAANRPLGLVQQSADQYELCWLDRWAPVHTHLSMRTQKHKPN